MCQGNKDWNFIDSVNETQQQMMPHTYLFVLSRVCMLNWACRTPIHEMKDGEKLRMTKIKRPQSIIQSINSKIHLLKKMRWRRLTGRWSTWSNQGTAHRPCRDPRFDVDLPWKIWTWKDWKLIFPPCPWLGSKPKRLVIEWMKNKLGIERFFPSLFLLHVEE